jgi:hypothetical protein
MDLTDIYRILHPKVTDYTFFLAPHGTFSKSIKNTNTRIINTRKMKLLLVFYQITIE